MVESVSVLCLHLNRKIKKESKLFTQILFREQHEEFCISSPPDDNQVVDNLKFLNKKSTDRMCGGRLENRGLEEDGGLLKTEE